MEKSVISEYRRIAQALNMIPDDQATAVILGCSNGAVRGARAVLKKEGYQFVQTNLHESRLHGDIYVATAWIVAKRPLSSLIIQDKIDGLKQQVQELQSQLTQALKDEMLDSLRDASSFYETLIQAGFDKFVSNSAIGRLVKAARGNEAEVLQAIKQGDREYLESLPAIGHITAYSVIDASERLGFGEEK